MNHDNYIGAYIAIFCWCCFVWSTASAADNTLRGLDAELQQVKREMLGLDEKVRLLTGGESQSAPEKISVYVSVDKDLSFQLDKVQLKLDGNTVSEYSFYHNQRNAMRLGGAANIHSETLLQGKHQLEAIFIGTGEDGKHNEYRQQWSLTQSPGLHTLIELHLGNSTFRQAPAIDMQVVD